MKRAPSTEEPCAANVACTVLKASEGGDPFAEPTRALKLLIRQPHNSLFYGPVFMLQSQKIISMSQATMGISLPDSLKEYVKERAEEECYSTPSDYMRSLIREDMRRRDEQKLERMLLEGVRSGRGMEIGSKEWKAFRKELVARPQAKQSKTGVWSSGEYSHNGKPRRTRMTFGAISPRITPKQRMPLDVIKEASKLLSAIPVGEAAAGSGEEQKAA
jgi:antitoxin ParD1/3/4